MRRARWFAPWRTAKRAFGWSPRRVGLDQCRRILVIRPDAIGDVVLTSPFFRGLRMAAPEAKITVLTNETCRPLLEHCPYIDEVHELPFKPIFESRDRARLVLAALRLKWSRMQRGVDLVLLPRADADWYSSELVAHLLAGPGAVFMNSAAFIEWTNNPPLSPGLADERHEVRTPQSDVLSNMELLAFCGGAASGGADLEFWSGPKDKDFAKDWLAGGDAGRPKLVFHPPSGRSLLKRWPMGRSRECLNKLIGETDFEVIVIGGDQDRWVLDELTGVESSRVRLAFDTFTLPQLGEMIRQCGYFVGGDSGPMHIAAAVGAKVVGIFGYASETRFRPWSDKAHVVSLRYPCTPDGRASFEANCQSCIHPENRCLTELSADRVLEEVLEFMQPAASR
jgi:ADP-heptose:LPS heptosyltransferase